MAEGTGKYVWVKPEYSGNSIVNLMSSILKKYGLTSSYEPLALLKPDDLKDSVNVILVILDGLGYEYLLKHGQNNVFAEYLKGKMTTVFPATTATAITTFVTGLAPQQHAVTGWFVYLKELGVVSTILPFSARFGGPSFGRGIIDPKIIFDYKSVFDKIKDRTFYLIHADLIDVDYTRALSGHAQRVPYYDLAGFFKGIEELVFSTKESKYIYAYWPKLDSLGHQYGIESSQALQHFKELNDRLALFVKSIEDTNTTVIITSDHGMVDTPDSRTIHLKEHPDFTNTLTMSVCGEPRVGYCYVRPARVDRFEEYVTTHFKDICSMYRAEELIEKGYFGLHKTHARLHDRVGDYVLIMKENYIMREFAIGEREHYFVSHHGGMTRQEMYVPLIVIQK
jgi:hypothetical protein